MHRIVVKYCPCTFDLFNATILSSLPLPPYLQFFFLNRIKKNIQIVRHTETQSYCCSSNRNSTSSDINIIK